MKTKNPFTWQRLLDDWRCRHTVRRWRRASRHRVRHNRLTARLRTLPYWHETGEFLYTVGFSVEYTALRAGRLALRLTGLLLHGLVDLLTALLRPLAESLPAPPGRGGQAGRLLGGVAFAAAAAGFWGLTRFVLAQPRLLLVAVNGETIGYAANEQVLDSAQAAATERIQNARAVLAAAGTPADAADWQLFPTYTLAITGDQPMTQTELVNALLQASGGELVQATAVYLDGELRFVTDEGDHLRSYLQSLLAPYSDVYDPNQQVSFAHGLTLSDGLFLTESVQSYADVLAQLQADGEALQVSTIERRSYTEAIPYETVTEESAEYAYGETVVVQAGSDGLREVTQDVVSINGVRTELRTVAVQTLQEPVTERIVTGTRLKDWMYGEAGGNEFIWPVPQYRQVSRWMGGGHTGTDIAAPAGTPIIASASGTVTTVHFWNGIVTQGDYNSYGNYVVIDHENGYRTLYGHMTYFIVGQGEHVEQGQVIGYVGETGYAFGAHLHYEMFGPNGRFNAHTVFPNAPRWNF